MGRITQWLSLHKWSTYMNFVTMIMVGTLAHPSLTSGMFILVIGSWLFITREVAHAEAGKSFNYIVLGVCTSIMLFAMVLMLKINWIAL